MLYRLHLKHGADQPYYHSYQQSLVDHYRFDEFVNDSKTYITTVGLYNENNELVAVAKLSVPVLKSFDTETLIKVKLDF